MNITYPLQPPVTEHQYADITRRITECHNQLVLAWQQNDCIPQHAFCTISRDALHTEQYTAAMAPLLNQRAQHIILLGIGGSSMGTRAVYHALAHVPHRAHHPKLTCFDTLDPLLTPQLLMELEHIIHNESYIVCIVSKSGTTLELNANAALVIDIVKRYHPTNYHNNCIVISEHGSPLMHWALEHNLHYASIPSEIGGRFSLFSAAGMIPLALLGYNIVNLRQGALHATQETFNRPAFTHDHHVTHITRYLASSLAATMNTHAWFIFAPHYYWLGLWYQQLLAESLGKTSPHGPVGLTPLISLGTVDLHSMVQLYLEGPPTITTNFVHITCSSSPTITIPRTSFTTIPEHTTLAQLHDALYQGTIAAYQQQQRPYMITDIMCTEYDIGYLMQLHMISIIYLGHLLEINAFDQPAVMLYKQAAYHYLNTYQQAK